MYVCSIFNARYTTGVSDPTQSDEEIVAQVQRGDADSFGELMNRYESKLLRYGSRFLGREDDVRDVVQDVFVRTYQNIQSFDLKQKFSPWMYRIAHNAFANELRRKSRSPKILPDFEILLGHTPSEESSDSESERASLVRLVEQGLTSIPPTFREILLLYFMEELSYKEISDVLRIPISSVGVRLARAKKALRARYQSRNISYEQ